ncbi:membrane protein [Lactiplantibacillus fabifermentans T30PCM01]|uniref:Membrane protein n=1 Tax=Lactiplantibacillus fabifermentans T30PCM01 TaxID=1400520 RepID=W6TCI4_9LACO|nr:PH domain-containing protein [Lactiplantibacillus fabifermentans]ETY74445.1 membrane protein [Lactiplantibacillus fabifermentans T30PCM01]
MTQQLPVTIKKVWLSSAIISGLVGLVITAALWGAQSIWHWWWWLPLAALILSILDVVVELALIPYRYAFWRYAITENEVSIRHGVIFKQTIAIPISRIQNVTLNAGPLLQLNHLQAVSIATAADSYDIDGVTPTVANQLREKIMQLAQVSVDEN